MAADVCKRAEAVELHLEEEVRMIERLPNGSKPRIAKAFTVEYSVLVPAA